MTISLFCFIDKAKSPNPCLGIPGHSQAGNHWSSGTLKCEILHWDWECPHSCLSFHHQRNDRQDPRGDAARDSEKISENRARKQEENKTVKGRKRCDVIPLRHFSRPSLESERWVVSCLTNALLANVSRPPTELHPSLWLWCFLVLALVCAQRMSPALSALIRGRRARCSHW